MADNKLHILAVSETWLNDSHDVHINNYVCVRNDRGLINLDSGKDTKGGGVAFFIHNSLKFSILAKSKIRNIGETEFIIVKVQIPSPKTSILLACIYRPPNGEAYDAFFEILNRQLVLTPNFLAFGDFNCHLEKECTDSIELKSLVNAAKIQIVPSGNTFHESSNESWLDVALVDDLTKIVSFNKSSVPFIDFHDSLILNYNLDLPQIPDKFYTFRNFKLCDIDQMKTDITLIVRENSNKLDSLPPEDVLNIFTNDIINILNHHAPLKTIKIKNNFKPWMNNHIRSQIQKRNRFYKIFKKTYNVKYHKLYKSQVKTLKFIERAAKNEYWKTTFTKCKDNAALYSLIRKLGYNNPKSTSPSALDFFHPQVLVDHIAATYSIHPSCTDQKLAEILHNFVPSAPFSFKSITFHETLSAFKKIVLKSKGNSIDGIRIKYLKDFLPQISTFCTKLFNTILKTRIYPDIWKKTSIVPLLKNSKPTSPDQTRPITNICHLAKPFDFILSKQLSDYLESNNFLSPFQSGYRMGFSTHTTLLKLLNDARKAISESKVTILLLYDFSKAFNSIDHVLLLKILRTIGFDDDSLTFFHSYLSNRCICIPGAIDAVCTCGVGQGTGPGGNLFLCAINSLVSAFIFTKILLFVDDAQSFIHSTVPNLNCAIEKINADSASLVKWCDQNGLKLNARKTQAIIIGSTLNLNQIKNMQLAPIMVGNCVIPISTSVKNLGLHISSDLKWNDQVNNIVLRTNKVFFFLNSKCRSLPIPIKKHIASQLLFPHFDYACVNFIDVTQGQSKKLESQLNKAVRFIFNLNKYSSISIYRKKLEWMPLHYRRKYFVLTQTFKVLKFRRPPYLFNLLEPYIINYNSDSQLNSVQTRSHPYFNIPYHTKKIYDFSFSMQAMIAWNELGVDVRSIDNLNIFKCRIKQILLNRANRVA